MPDITYAQTKEQLDATGHIIHIHNTGFVNQYGLFQSYYDKQLCMVAVMPMNSLYKDELMHDGTLRYAPTSLWPSI